MKHLVKSISVIVILIAGLVIPSESTAEPCYTCTPTTNCGDANHCGMDSCTPDPHCMPTGSLCEPYEGGCDLPGSA